MPALYMISQRKKQENIDKITGKSRTAPSNLANSKRPPRFSWRCV